MRNKKFFKISEELVQKVGKLTEYDVIVIHVPARMFLDESFSNHGEKSIIESMRAFWTIGCKYNYDIIIDSSSHKYATIDIETKEEFESRQKLEEKKL